MSQILRRGEIDSDDEYDNTEQAPQIQTPAPQIPTPVNVKETKPAKVPKIPKVHVCEHCGETFARSTSLTKHVKELRCQVKRRQTLDKQLELAEKERKLRDLENEISNKILKSQENFKKPDRKSVV